MATVGLDSGRGFSATFQNPLVLAAGTAGFGRELDGVMALDRLGGLITKAVSLVHRAGNKSPRVAEFPGGMLNSIGLANPGVDQVKAEALPWLATHVTKARVLVNVVGFRIDEYAEVIRRLDDVAVITGYEINLSCPNTSAGGIEFGADAGAVARIIGSCRRATRRPLMAKLSPVLPDIPTMAAVAIDNGATGISVVNTMPGLIFEGTAARLGNGNGGVSGPALLPVGLLATSRVRNRLPDVPILGLGGVRSAADVEQYRQAGADLVGIGTAALADPHLPERIVAQWEQRG